MLYILEDFSDFIAFYATQHCIIWMPVMGNIPPDYIPLKGSARIYAEKGIINLNELISLTLWLVFKKYFLIKNAFKMMF